MSQLISIYLQNPRGSQQQVLPVQLGIRVFEGFKKKWTFIHCLQIKLDILSFLFYDIIEILIYYMKSFLLWPFDLRKSGLKKVSSGKAGYFKGAQTHCW